MKIGSIQNRKSTTMKAGFNGTDLGSESRETELDISTQPEQVNRDGLPISLV